MTKDEAIAQAVEVARKSKDNGTGSALLCFNERQGYNVKPNTPKKREQYRWVAVVRENGTVEPRTFTQE